MKYSKILLMAAVAGCVVQALAAEESERDVFRKWRLAIGGAFNGRVTSDLNARNLPIPDSPVSLAPGHGLSDAMSKAGRHQYDGGGYIDFDSAVKDETQNWQLPESSYRGNGLFILDNAYQEFVPGTITHTGEGRSEDPCQFGISLEASRELWLHDENDEHRWGVDFAAAVSYFFQRDLYKERGDVTRTDGVLDGVVRTVVDDSMATQEYDYGGDSPANGYYGYGNSGEMHPFLPSLHLVHVGEGYNVPGATTMSSATAYYDASGDYQELEMLFLLRPWYEITDWWRVYANVGVGVSWGRFDSEFRGLNVYAEEDFSQWDVYGAAGLGTMFRYGCFDLSVDFLGRFLRDDMDINGRYVEGTISRADWGFRVMVGVEF